MKGFFEDLPGPIDHILMTAGGPHYKPMLEMDADEVRHGIADHVVVALEVARNAAGRMRSGGSCSSGGTGAGGSAATSDRLGGDRRPAPFPPPRPRAGARAGQPDRRRLRRHPASASLLGDQLDARREQLRTTLPIGRVVGPEDVAALAVHLMTNTALTGATYDIDGGQQLV